MSETPTPLPCPFCGGKLPILDRKMREGYDSWPDDPDAYAYSYRCRACAATGGWGKSEGSALRLWNLRTPHPEA